MREGDISATELLEATLAEIDRLDPIHHAFIWQDRDGARARARTLDADRAGGKTLGPLHGMPMAHKDMYYRAGRVSSFGSRVPDGQPAKATAVALHKLDQAGAIDVGGLAMVEFAMGPHGYNANLPRALNPWGHDRVPCGSSSGSGVAVASRMAYASLGSDTGGSIRCPAAANGIVGCLPTYDLVSRRGSMAMSWSLDCVGPLTRTVRDAARVLTAIAEPAMRITKPGSGPACPACASAYPRATSTNGSIPPSRKRCRRASTCCAMPARPSCRSRSRTRSRWRRACIPW